MQTYLCPGCRRQFEGFSPVDDPMRNRPGYSGMPTCSECGAIGIALDPAGKHFTDRARAAMQLAREQAEFLEHECICTEHILLGLAKEGQSVAAHILVNRGIDLRKLRWEVDKLRHVDRREGFWNWLFPPIPVVRPRLLPLTPWAKAVIKHSIEEALNLKHPLGQHFARYRVVSLPRSHGEARRRRTPQLLGIARRSHLHALGPLARRHRGTRCYRKGSEEPSSP
jgi:hypothetical protein